MFYLTVNSAGLLLNIIGVGLIFWFGLPAEQSRADRELLFPSDPADVGRARMYDGLGYSGLILLMVGFFLQLAANLVQATVVGVPA